MNALTQLRMTLSGDDGQDSRAIENILQQLLLLRQERPQLFTSIPYTIVEKGKNDRRRLEIMLSSKFPEPETLKLLNKNAQNWLNDPAQFWKHPSLPDTNRLPPGARIASCYLIAKRLDT